MSNKKLFLIAILCFFIGSIIGVFRNFYLFDDAGLPRFNEPSAKSFQMALETYQNYIHDYEAKNGFEYGQYEYDGACVFEKPKEYHAEIHSFFSKKDRSAYGVLVVENLSNGELKIYQGAGLFVKTNCYKNGQVFGYHTSLKNNYIFDVSRALNEVSYLVYKPRSAIFQTTVEATETFYMGFDLCISKTEGNVTDCYSEGTRYSVFKSDLTEAKDERFFVAAARNYLEGLELGGERHYSNEGKLKRFNAILKHIKSENELNVLKNEYSRIMATANN
tara:strand:- start:44 stop:871 length:828 start_codon:yes stop_codon:yes gene_type:complete